jgi:hypothetical protein
MDILQFNANLTKTLKMWFLLVISKHLEKIEFTQKLFFFPLRYEPMCRVLLERPLMPFDQ